MALEEDFLPEKEPASQAVIHPMPHASVLVVLTVEPGTGRMSGSQWKVSCSLEHPIKFKNVFESSGQVSDFHDIAVPSLQF